MWTRRRTTIWINTLGGIAVLGSYAACIGLYPEAVGNFWGGVPEALRSVYTLNMGFAAAGYFAFTFFLLYRLNAGSAASASGGWGYGTFNTLYALVLIPSALWMPLTFVMLESPSPALWLAIRAVLAAVGIGSLGILFGLLVARPAQPTWVHRGAVLGSVFFCLQTAVLDAIVWPAYFAVSA